MKSLGLTLRQRKILHTVLNRKDYITSAELAAALKVSSRTVRNDIGRLNHILGPYHAVITATQSKGVLLRTEEPEQLRELMNMDTAFFTREDRVRYLAFRLCLNDSPLNLYDLEDELFISHTALMTDIRSLREKYSNSVPHILLHTTRDEIWFEADELKLRYVLLNLFHEDWDYGTTENAYYGFDFLDGALLSLLTKNVSKILFRFGIVMDDPTLVSLELTLAIMHYRVLKGHPFPDYLPLPDGSSPESAATQALFELVEAHTRYIYPMPERARIREMIATGRFVPAEGLNDPAALTIKQTAICYLAEIEIVNR